MSSLCGAPTVKGSSCKNTGNCSIPAHIDWHKAQQEEPQLEVQESPRFNWLNIKLASDEVSLDAACVNHIFWHSAHTAYRHHRRMAEGIRQVPLGTRVRFRLRRTCDTCGGFPSETFFYNGIVTKHTWFGAVIAIPAQACRHVPWPPRASSLVGVGFSVMKTCVKIEDPTRQLLAQVDSNEPVQLAAPIDRAERTDAVNQTPVLAASSDAMDTASVHDSHSASPPIVSQRKLHPALGLFVATLNIRTGTGGKRYCPGRNNVGFVVIVVILVGSS